MEMIAYLLLAIVAVGLLISLIDFKPKAHS